MEHSPSSGANSFSASQEILRISLYPEVHYRIHKRWPAFAILGQINPFQAFCDISFNIIVPSTPSLPSGLFPSGLSTKTLYTLLLYHIYVENDL
jgi:hypothetical protein